MYWSSDSGCIIWHRIQFVYSKRESNEAKLVLIKAIKNGGEFLKIDKPLYIYEDDGSYSEEILKIYNIEKEKNNGK